MEVLFLGIKFVTKAIHQLISPLQLLLPQTGWEFPFPGRISILGGISRRAGKVSCVILEVGAINGQLCFVSLSRRSFASLDFRKAFR